MEKKFIDSIGLDGDGIINDLDFYQYVYGTPYFLSKYCKENGIDLPFPKHFYSPEYFLKRDVRTRDEFMEMLLGEFYQLDIDFDLGNIIKNPNAYDIQDIFGCTKLERQLFWLQHFPKYCTNYPIRPEASHYINKWQKEGRKVHFITARAFVKNKIVGPWVRNKFENTLDENGIMPDSITYCREKESPIDKAVACEKYGVMVMAEDKVENIRRLSSFIPVVSFAASYNEDCMGNNIIRTHNDFAGIDKFITEYESGLQPKVMIKRR